MERHHFQSSGRRGLLCETLRRLAAKCTSNLQAWAVFYYHWVGLSPHDPATLRTLVSELDTQTSSAVNEADHTPGRQVCFQYWETRLTHQRSYLARLKSNECGRWHDSASRGTLRRRRAAESRAARAAKRGAALQGELRPPYSSLAGNLAAGVEAGRLRSGLSVCGSGRSGKAGAALPVRPKA